MRVNGNERDTEKERERKREKKWYTKEETTQVFDKRRDGTHVDNQKMTAPMRMLRPKQKNSHPDVPPEMQKEENQKRKPPK
ncbi:hypothetical protein RUM43_010426 [Polyplax serrata]|uniref:Uncharacterized protein n=1 Tax=Polyplax serrata TaxID=468196 RepID=A0AAN8S821_POLSC